MTDLFSIRDLKLALLFWIVLEIRYFYQEVLALKLSRKAVNKAERKMKSLILKAYFHEDCSCVSAHFSSFKEKDFFEPLVTVTFIENGG